MIIALFDASKCCRSVALKIILRPCRAHETRIIAETAHFTRNVLDVEVSGNFRIPYHGALTPTKVEVAFSVFPLFFGALASVGDDRHSDATLSATARGCRTVYPTHRSTFNIKFKLCHSWSLTILRTTLAELKS